MAQARSITIRIALVCPASLALLGFLATLAAAEIPFWPARLEIATGPDPVAVVALDLEVDGVMDLAVAHRGSGDVQIWLGRGDGTFAPGPKYPLAVDHPGMMAVADLNADASPDLITADNAGAISVLLGLGDGTFASPLVSPGLPSTMALAVGDVDGDQLPDLAVAGATLGILPGLGDGTFAPPRMISSQFYYQAVLLTDLDGDRHLELLTGANGLEVRLGNGDGTFAPPVTYQIGAVTSIVAGELAGDRTVDVAVAAFDGETPVVQALEGLGKGALLPHERSLLPGPPLALATGHLDRDPDLDLAAAGYIEFSSAADGMHRITQGGLAVLLNRGDGTFAGAVEHEAGQAPQALAIANLDRDGAADVVVANRSGSLAVLLGTGDGTLAATPFFELAWNENPTAIALADLDRDGAADLVLGGDQYFAALHVRQGHGDGTFGPADTYPVHDPSSLSIADLDGDGQLDVAARHANGEVAVLLGHGDGTLGAPVFYPLIADLNAIASGDLTGDGVPDLAGVAWTGWPPQHGRFAVAPGRGDGTFDPPVVHFAHDLGRALAIGDLTADGLPDLALLFEGTGGPGILNLHRNRGDGVLAWLGSYTTGANPRALALGDIDRDGDDDIAIANSGSGDVWLYRNRGDGNFDILDPVPVGDWPMALAITDLSGDGTPDLAVANYYGANVTVLEGRGDGTFNAPAWYGVIEGAYALAPGAIDGNPGTDLAISGQYVSRLSLLLSAPREPVAVDITTFTAMATSAGIIVRWEAGEESGTLGYQVHRTAGGSGGQRVQITGDLVLAGARRYVVTDTDAPPGRHDYWLEEIARSGDSRWIGPRTVALTPAAPVLRAWAEPVPFAEETAFVIARGAGGAVRLRIYDLAGRLVRELLDPGIPPAETLRLPWAGTDQSGRRLPAGVYFYSVANGSETVTGKVTIAR